MPGKIWTKAKIIAEIKHLHLQGADLSPTAAQIEHSALFSSARSVSHFGSWRAAIEAAELNYDDLKRIKQCWTRQEIAKRIGELHEAGEDLLDPQFKTRHRKLYLAACAHRYFGSWRRAIEDAGLDHEKMRESRVWTRNRILQTIKQLASEGEPLGWAYIEQHEPGIYRAARRKENFGSWANALLAAGVDDAHPRIVPPTHRAPTLYMSGAGEAEAPAETADDEAEITAQHEQRADDAENKVQF